MAAIKLHRHALSGHSHRVELFLSILGLDAEIVDVDLASGAHKSAEFLAKNPLGQVPVLDDGALSLADSNAILVYLASQYDQSGRWLPKAPADAAEVQRFLSIAAGKVASGPAVARIINVFNTGMDPKGSIAVAHTILAQINDHLVAREWLATNSPTIADLANYAYIAHAPEGDVSLETYPHIKSWLQRIENLPGFVPMQASAVGLNA